MDKVARHRPFSPLRVISLHASRHHTHQKSNVSVARSQQIDAKLLAKTTTTTTQMHSITRIMSRSLSTSTAAAAAADGPVSKAILDKLTTAFAPTHLEIRNESYMHNV
jgi:stress-induced morphogen